MSDRAQTKSLRCAIYTRKSSEEGLEQDFNSLHAQREACEAFISSQRHEGWSVIETAYDDGGFSGATMERPAIRTLLDDVRTRKVDVVVVYKVDRLTRSLSDFARIVEVFDAHDVSFVSVTQQFNTTSSMGRLTLNVLLSFAQFEREVTGERIRDKFRASRKKGIWMGGHPSLGYDIKDRMLVVNEQEAETVRMLFRRYAELGSVNSLKAELDAKAIVSKLRVSETGRRWGGKPIARGALYQILRNQIYLGKAVHKGKVYDGEHAAIIDQELWDKVQTRLAENRVRRRNGSTAKEPSLLAGLIYDLDGERLTPSHSVKSGKRYRYYVSRRLISPAPDRASGSGWRIPAGEIEPIVLGALRDLLTDRGRLWDQLGDQIDGSRAFASAVMRGTELAEQMDKTGASERRQIALSIVRSVTVKPDEIKIAVNLPGVLRMLAGEPDQSGNDPSRDSDLREPLTISVPARLKRCGMEMRLILDGDTGVAQPRLDPTLIKTVARAHLWFEKIASGAVSTVRGLSIDEGVDERHVARILKLAFLAPALTAAILEGRQPPELTADTLIKINGLPLLWSEQQARLGSHA